MAFSGFASYHLSAFRRCSPWLDLPAALRFRSWDCRVMTRPNTHIEAIIIGTAIVTARTIFDESNGGGVAPAGGVAVGTDATNTYEVAKDQAQMSPETSHHRSGLLAQNASDYLQCASTYTRPRLDLNPQTRCQIWHGRGTPYLTSVLSAPCSSTFGHCGHISITSVYGVGS